MMATREQRSQQKSAHNQSGKVEKKTNDTVGEDPLPFRKIGDTEPVISTKLSRSQFSKVPYSPRKPKSVARCIEATYAMLTEPEGRKPKTTLEAKKRLCNSSESKRKLRKYSC